MTPRTLLPLLFMVAMPLQARADCVSDADCTGAGEFCIDGACAVPADSCWGRCGGQAPEGCWCDEACDQYGDCCGDICDACAELALCCQPDCTEKDCGDDGCGGTCGTCAPGEVCGGDGLCEPCTPACDGKQCGDDSCGGTCGDCDPGLTCAKDGTACLDCGACAPWEVCDDGACAAPPPLAACPMGGTMIAAACHDTPWEGCCAGADLYYCESADLGGCPPGVQDCLCHVSCDPDGTGDLTCGWGQQLFLCAPPPAQSAPDGQLSCAWADPPPACEEICAGAECGVLDACDCGSCDDGETCVEGICVAERGEDVGPDVETISEDTFVDTTSSDTVVALDTISGETTVGGDAVCNPACPDRGCAVGGGNPAAGLLVIFLLLGLAVIPRRATV